MRLVGIAYINKRGECFFPLPNRPRIKCRPLCRNSFSFDGNGGFLAGKACYFVIQSGNNFRKTFHPRSGPLALRESHFYGVLVAHQAQAQPGCGWNIQQWPGHGECQPACVFNLETSFKSKKWLQTSLYLSCFSVYYLQDSEKHKKELYLSEIPLQTE